MNFKIKSLIMWALIVICLCVFVWSGYHLYQYIKEYDELDKTYDEAQSMVQIETIEINNETETSEPTYDIDHMNNSEEMVDSETGPIDEYKDLKINIDINWEKLSSQSNDVVGWLYIPDTNINYPIVHKDNEYYLNHDYAGKWNSGGSIFLEQTATLNSQNIIIYGHHMKADIMFHRLTNYADQKFADSHKYIYIVTKNETRIYQVFSVVYTDHLSDTYTCDFNKGSKITFDQYIHNAIDNSVIKTDVRDITANDRIISLSTCTGRIKTERLVVHAVLLDTY